MVVNSPYSTSGWGAPTVVNGRFTARATGTPSNFGRNARSGRSILNPWGSNFAKPKAPSKLQKFGGSARRQATPDSSLYSMAYKTNDPLAWPIEGGRRGSISGMTQAKVDWNNAVVNHAFERTTGLS